MQSGNVHQRIPHISMIQLYPGKIIQIQLTTIFIEILDVKNYHIYLTCALKFINEDKFPFNLFVSLKNEKKIEKVVF